MARHGGQRRHLEICFLGHSYIDNIIRQGRDRRLTLGYLSMVYWIRIPNVTQKSSLGIKLEFQLTFQYPNPTLFKFPPVIVFFALAGRVFFKHDLTEQKAH